MFDLRALHMEEDVHLKAMGKTLLKEYHKDKKYTPGRSLRAILLHNLLLELK